MDIFGSEICITISLLCGLLERQLQSLQQGSQTFAEYLGVPNPGQKLMVKGRKPVEDDNLFYILGILNQAYTAFITSYNFATRNISMTFQDFQVEISNFTTLLGNQHQSVGDSGSFALYTLTSQNPRGQTTAAKANHLDRTRVITSQIKNETKTTKILSKLTPIGLHAKFVARWAIKPRTIST